MAPSKIRGIIFDLDGTLVNSKIDFPEMKRRMIAILESNGVPKGLLTPNETNVIILEKAERAWDEGGKPEAERSEVRALLEEAMNQGELKALPSMREVPGASEAIHELGRRGYRLGVLTRSHHAYAIEALRKMGVEGEFNAVLGRGETPRPKPYPEALQHASTLMGIPLEAILFVGDHHIDSTSAVNADCAFIGVRTGPRGDKSWEENRPDVLLDSVADLPEYLEERSR
jgi:phosphoglycolate phosphatase